MSDTFNRRRTSKRVNKSYFAWVSSKVCKKLQYRKIRRTEKHSLNKGDWEILPVKYRPTAWYTYIYA